MNKPRRYAPRRQNASRRWHIPPPLVHGPDTLEGGGILHEWAGETGVVLWQASRDVMLWTISDPKSRSLMFAPAAAAWYSVPDVPGGNSELDDRAQGALLLLRQLVVHPSSMKEDHVARACRQISEWADERGKLGTALAFAQNAALTARNDAAAAFWVATVAVRLNDHPRAEVWFRRAIGLARQGRDWRMYSRAFGGLGNLYMRRGNLPAARRLHTRALRGARRGGMRREQAASLHDLFAVAVEMGQPVEAERLAEVALQVFGRRNRRVHVLAHDVAYFWMEQGFYARALSVFHAVLPLIEKPIERLFVLADIARAAGGCNDRELAEEASEEVRRFATQPELEHGAGRALIEVARAYVSLGDRKKADATARQAIRSAMKFRESKVRFAAEALLEALKTSVAQASPESPAPATPDRSYDPITGDRLAADFVKTLEGIAAEPRN